MSAELLPAARAALAAGQRDAAKALLLQAVRSAPTGEAWHLLAQCLDDPAQQADCHRRAAQLGYSPPPPTPRPAPPAVQAAPPPRPPEPQPQRAAPSGPTDRQLIQQAAQYYVGRGWQIAMQTDDSLQVKKPRRVSQAGLLFLVLLPLFGGIVWPLLWGVAVFGLLFVGVDYLLRKDKLEYITAQELRLGRRQDVTVPRAPIFGPRTMQQVRIAALVAMLGLILAAGAYVAWDMWTKLGL